MSGGSVRHLKELVIRYCDWGGSSRGVREFIRSNVVEFAVKNPECQVTTMVKRNKHPFVRGMYLNGKSKTICVKNLTPEQVMEYAVRLRNEAGKKVLPLKRPVYSGKPSIQVNELAKNRYWKGEWHERMSLLDLELAVEHKY